MNGSRRTPDILMALEVALGFVCGVVGSVEVFWSLSHLGCLTAWVTDGWGL